MSGPGPGPPGPAGPPDRTGGHASPNRPATGYTYALPGGWVHLDLDPSRRAASVRRAVGGRIRREPRLRPHLAKLDRLLLRECEVAAAAGADRVSLLTEATPQGIRTAAMTFGSAGLAVEEAVTPSASMLREALAGENARALGRDPTASLTVVNLAGLGVDAAVRREWSESRQPVSRSWQLVLPWPGRARVGLLTLSSSAEELWPRLGVLFDACGQTFRWTSDDEPPAAAPNPSARSGGDITGGPSPGY